jgi:molybdopterin synthase sulfur carrier subunit
MAVKVLIPSLLRPLTGGLAKVEVEAGTVAAVIDAVDTAYPGVRERILDADGRMNRFINLFVEGEDVRFLDCLRTPVPLCAEVSIVPAVAGGRTRVRVGGFGRPSQ